MVKANIELDAIRLGCIQAALNLSILQTQATLAALEEQIKAQLDAEAAAVPAKAAT